MADRTFEDKALIAVLGPIKLEIVPLTDVSDGDSFTSRLQSPIYADVFNNGDIGGANVTISASVSGRSVTIHDPNLTSVVALVWGL